MHQPYTSDTLYHMVGWGVLHDDKVPAEEKDEQCYQRLKMVLDFGFISGADHNGVRAKEEGIISLSIDTKGHLRNGDFDGYLVKGCYTCYADIPVESLGLHTSKYGKFGFGISAPHLVALGARPVTYIPCRSGWIESDYRGHGLLNNLTEELLKLHRIVEEYEEANNEEDEEGVRTIDNRHEWSGLNNALWRDVAVFLKPYNATLPMDHPKSYYSEREWRLLGNVQISPKKVPVIVVAHGYKERLLSEVPATAEFEIMELSA